MKTLLDTLNSNTPHRLLQYALLGAGVWLGVTVLTTGAQSLRTSGKAAAAIGEYERIRSEAGQARPGAREQLQTLSRNSLFVRPPSQAAVPNSQAILGDSVLIGDQWYRAGQTVQGFEISEVGADFVTVLRDGKEHRIIPFATDGGNSRPARPPTQTSSREPDRGDMRGRGEMRGRGGPPADGPGGQVMEMRGRIEAMTPEQRQEMFQRFRNASPEERERLREEYSRGGNN